MVDERQKGRESKTTRDGGGSKKLTASSTAASDATNGDGRATRAPSDMRRRRRRLRRRRSLFSRIFTSGNQSSDCSASSSSENENENQSSVQESRETPDQEQVKKVLGTGRHTCDRRDVAPRQRDIVLVKAREAKCVEATVVSLVTEKGGCGGHDESAELKSAAESQRTITPKSTIQSLVKRRIKKFKESKRAASQDADADSYILDLNDCLDREKSRISSSSSSSSSALQSSSSSPTHSLLLCDSLKTTSAAASKEAKERKLAPKCVGESAEKKCSAPLREASPIDDLWHTNQEYIPSHNETLSSNNNNNNNNNEGEPQKKTIIGKQLTAVKRERTPGERQTRSPLLSELLNSCPLGDDCASSSSSCDGDIWPRAAARRKSKGPRTGGPILPPVSYYDELSAAASPLGASKLNNLSESDRRLYHWRKLAARSVSMWQVPDESSSDEDNSDDLGDFVDSAARVCYCSDDTSCSSVELIWSRPSNALAAGSTGGSARSPTGSDRSPSAAEAQRQRLLLLTSTRPVHLLTTPSSQTATPSSSELNLSRASGSASPARGQLLSINAATAAAPALGSFSRSPTPQRLQVYNMMMMRHGAKRDSKLNSNSSLRSSSQSNVVPCQKASILELAKPSRARDRRIGGDNNGRQRSRRASSMAASNKAARRSMPAPPVTRHDNLSKLSAQNLRAVESKTARDSESAAGRQETDGHLPRELSRESSVPPASRPASGSDWVPNPLFGRPPSAPSPPVDREAESNQKAFTRAASFREGQQGRQVAKSKSSDEPQPRAPQGAPLDLPEQSEPEEPEEPKTECELASGGGGGSAAKSSRFRNFLARIKRQSSEPSRKSPEEAEVGGDNGNSEQGTTKSRDKSSAEEREDLDEFDDGSGTGGGALGAERGKRHRWSLRMRAPFNNHHQNQQQRQDHMMPSAAETNHAYLSHFVNLDKRIKSNVSSLKSQLGERLSDTGKRASVLADQLIASIKDTTKEQLLMATTGTPARDRYDTMPNSFAPSSGAGGGGGDGALSPNDDPLLVQRQLLVAGGGQEPPTGDLGLGSTSERKAKLFSLIYMHQQQQATGKPVITRQPTATTLGNRNLLAHKPARPLSSGLSVAADSPNVTPAPLSNSETKDAQQHEAINLEKLLDPKELLLDKFKALERSARVQSGAVHQQQRRLTNSCQRRMSSIVCPGRAVADFATSHAALATKEPKRRSSCTV